MKNRLLSCAIILLTVGIISNDVLAEDVVSSREINFGYYSGVDVIDPAYCTATGSVQLHAAISDSLVRIAKVSDSNESNQILIKPAGAVSWTVSADKKTYNFDLRRDATWSDGRPVLADDYVLAFQRIFDSRLDEHGRPTYLLGAIENAKDIVEKKQPVSTLGIKALGDWKLQIRLSSPVSYFLHILTYPCLVPVPGHVISEYGNDWDKKLPLVSNGAYSIVEVSDDGAEFGDIITLQSNKNHYSVPAFDRMNMRLLNSNDRTLKLISENKLDVIVDSEASERNIMLSSYFDAYKTQQLRTGYFVLNAEDGVTRDVRVRQALDLLIDRRHIAEALESQYALSIVPDAIAGNSYYEDVSFANLSRAERVDKANSLLSQAMGSMEEPIKLKLLIANTVKNMSIVQGLRSMLREANIEIELDLVLGSQYLVKIDNRDWDIALTFWSADYPDPMTFLGIFRSDHDWNKGGWENIEYDELVDAALWESDSGSRADLYQNLHKILMNEVPLVPIVYLDVMVFYSSKINKPTFSPAGYVQLRELSLALD